jgi:hypothetical protein
MMGGGTFNPTFNVSTKQNNKMSFKSFAAQPMNSINENKSQIT